MSFLKNWSHFPSSKGRTMKIIRVRHVTEGFPKNRKRYNHLKKTKAKGLWTCHRRVKFSWGSGGGSENSAFNFGLVLLKRHTFFQFRDCIFLPFMIQFFTLNGAWTIKVAISSQLKYISFLKFEQSVKEQNR